MTPDFGIFAIIHMMRYDRERLMWIEKLTACSAYSSTRVIKNKNYIKKKVKQHPLSPVHFQNP